MQSKFIQRNIENELQEFLGTGKALLIFGARQVGKTTCIHDMLKKSGKSILHLNADEPDVRRSLSNVTSTQLRMLFGSHELIYIDEAQRIDEVGITLKLIADVIKEVQVIATGSSAFDLASKIKESLTGRKYEFHMFPFSFEELANHHGIIEERRHLEQRMVFGSYPEIVSVPRLAKKNLKMLADSYLYKDLFVLDNIKRPKLLEKIAQAIALQVGSEVSINELSRLVGANHATVEKYLDMLEKAFITFSLTAFRRNVRNEIKKGRKIYFYDNGIRNAVINNFKPLRSRTDVGALWENYIISERMKFVQANQIECGQYFWRTTQQQEIDYIEVEDDEIKAVEFKWNPKSKHLFSKTFLNAYQPLEKLVVSPENYHTYISSSTRRS